MGVACLVVHEEHAGIEISWKCIGLLHSKEQEKLPAAVLGSPFNTPTCFRGFTTTGWEYVTDNIRDRGEQRNFRERKGRATTRTNAKAISDSPKGIQRHFPF